MENIGKNINRILFVVVAVVCLLVGYFVGDSGIFKSSNENRQNNSQENNSNDNNNQNDVDPVVTELDLNNEDVITLSKPIKLLEQGKYIDYFRNSDKVDVASENIAVKLYLSYAYIPDINIKTESVTLNGELGILQYIDENTVKEAYYKLFGNNAEYRRTSHDMSNVFGVATYNEEKNRYESYVNFGSEQQTTNAYAKIIGADKEITSTTEKINIYESYIYIDKTASGNLYYSDSKKMNMITVQEFNLEPSEVLERYSKDVGKYKYTFERSTNGNYIFTGIERVK